ncbi:TRAP transporter substrate-binding protein [Vibrio sp. DNB22_10_4]
MKKTLLSALLVASSTTSLAWADVNIRIGHGAPSDYHMNLAWLHFKDLVESESNGEVTVDIYANGQIGADRELIESVQDGVIEITTPTVDMLAGWDPAYSLIGLPYAFSGREEALSKLYGDFGHELLRRAENIGMVGLGWMENGIREITTNTKPIYTYDDMRGMKIRTMQVQAHIEAFSAMGASPTPMSFNEVYSALQQGVIDAQENPITHVYSSRFYEVQKYLSRTNHVYSTHIVLANPEFYYGLSDEHQKLVNSALERSIEYQNEVIEKREKEFLGKIKESGVLVNELSSEQISDLQEKTESVRQKYYKMVDKKVVDSLLN